MQNKNLTKSISEIFYAALKAVDPAELIRSYGNKILSLCEHHAYKNINIVGFGKGACQMSRAIEDIAGDCIESGIVITKYGYNISRQSGVRSQKSKIKIQEAGHPVPDENGLKGTEEIIELLEHSDENTPVICLISGGGSALLVSPYEGITLTEKQRATDLLLKSGASIEELNTVRKHISKVKGGRLVELAYPAKVISLILSDVIGDKLDVIASGPTSPDNTTFTDALKVIERYGLIDRIPRKVLEILQSGAGGFIAETPKEGDELFDRVENILIGNNRKALEAAKSEAERFGYQTEILNAGISGEAAEVGKWLARKTREVHNIVCTKEDCKMCLISGGETTVTVRGTGLGGRNMEVALSFAIEIAGVDRITLLSAGTDGTDGPTDAAGAIVDGATITRARARGLNPENYLENNDSYTFFKETGNLFITGPTGTNVMDIQIVVIE
jgi:glycerate-2-kinase